MVSVEISNMELALAQLFAHVCNLGQHLAHAIYFEPRAPSLRVDVLKAAAEEAMRVIPRHYAPSALSEDDKANRQQQLSRVRGIISGAKSALGKRNELMHATWSVTIETNQVHRESVDEVLERGGKPVPIQELNDLIRAIRTVIDEIVDYTGEEVF